MKILVALFLTSFLLACAEIQHYEHVSKPTNTVQTASIGSELYRIQKQRDLPNAFGKADLYGGKVDEGFSELRFMGLTENGQIVFRITDIDIVSNESVFTRYGVSRSTINTSTTANAHLIGDSVHGQANSNSVINHYRKPEAQITELPPNTVEFVFDPRKKMLNLEGVDVEIIEADEYTVSYVLHKK